MKNILLMLFVALGVTMTSQAQGVVDVQDNATYSILERVDYAKTNVVCFVYKDNTLKNSIRVTTSDSAYAEVLANTFDLKSHELKNGKHIFEFGCSVKEARIYTNLVSANSGKFHIHRVVYNS